MDTLSPHAKDVILSISESAQPLAASSPEALRAQLRDFFARVGDLDRIYRPLLAASRGRCQRTVSEALASSLCQACEALLNGCSQAERRVYRLQRK